MGDVFNAMNRAKNERASTGPGAATPGQTPESAPGQGGAEGEQPGLPLRQVEAAAQARRAEFAGEESAGVLAASVLPAAPVAVASERALEEESAKPAASNIIAAPTLEAHPGVEGYSPELIVHYDRGSVVTEQYRAIRTQILARTKNRRLQVTVVTSAAPGEGKTVSVLNLGMTFAEIRNKKSILVECDLRRPCFAQRFGRNQNPGLLHYLRGETDDLDRIICPTLYDNLQFIPAGEADMVNSTELLSSPRMVKLIDRFRDRYDFIFLDTPPVVTVTDPCILGSMADQTLLVVRLNKTPSEIVDRAKRLLRASNCDVAGVILTHLRPDLSRYAYRYAYGYYYGSRGR